MKQKRLGKKIAVGITSLAMLLTTVNLSAFAQAEHSSEPVKFKNEKFGLWIIQAFGIDTNHDGVISQAELDRIETLTINDETAHWVPQSSLFDFQNLADIRQMHGLKNLEIDFYDPNYLMNGNRQPLKDIDFPDSLENLSMRNIYWKKDIVTKSHDNADIIFTNLKRLELYNSDVEVKEGDDSYFDHPTQIELTDTDGVLQSCIIERTDVASIKLINNSNGKGLKNQDEKQRIRFSAPKCQNLKSIEFLGEGYAVEGSLDLENDIELTHIGIFNEDKSQWTVYGEFDSTYAPIDVILNGCTQLGSDCNEILIDYDFINGRNLNVQTMDTNFSDDHKLTIFRQPRIEGDRAGDVYLSCDNDDWVHTKYHEGDGFVIEDRTSHPTIAVFADGQRIRTSGEGNHNSDSKYTEDTDRWVERHNLVLKPGGNSSCFANLKFYVVDKVPDSKNGGMFVDSLRRVFYKDDVYVEWEQQEYEDPIIILPTEKDVDGKGNKLTGTELKSTGKSGEVELKLYVYEKNSEGAYVKSYIGFQNIKIYEMPDSVELLNDGTKRGSGTKDDPYIVDKNEELKLKAHLLVNGKVDRSGDYALREVEWRIKAYNETPKDTSDADGYSKYGSKLTITPEVRVVRGRLDPGETEEQYDKRVDNIGGEPEYYNHRRLIFDTDGLKFKIVAGLKNELNIYKEVFVEYHIFSSDCDTTCNGCGYERVAPKVHNFVNKECSGCKIKECVVTGNHDFSGYVSNGNSTHKMVCKVCDSVQTGHESDACSGGTATCMARAKCSKCGAEYGNKADHVYGTPIFISSADGKTCTVEIKCKIPGCTHKLTKTATVISKLKTKATCKSKGVTTYTYKYDTYTDSKDVTDIAKDSKNHIGGTKVKNKKVATYFEKGYTGDTVCKSCNKVTKKGKAVAVKKLSKLALSSVKSPKSKLLTAMWKKVKDATGYELQYTTDKKFKKLIKTVKIKKVSTLTTTIKKLTGKETYYVRIRAYKTGKVNKKNKTIYSDWSAPKNVKVKK